MRLNKLIGILGLSLGLTAFPAQAQISQTQVSAFVEALRQAAPNTGRVDDGLYSEWQIKPENIPRWSKQCIGRELTPTQFEQSPATARQILSCVLDDILIEQYRASGNNETLAVRRAAAWWMTGDPNQYNSSTALSNYTQKVLGFYQNGRGTATTTTTPTQNNAVAYDRHMRAGYTATQQRKYPEALEHFQRALAERPNDPYATQAIRNVQSYITKNASATSSTPTTPSTSSTPSTPSTPSSSSLTQQQAVTLINQWLQAKTNIFAPPFEQQLVNDLTTGELQSSLIKADGVMSWLQNNNAYYRFGVQKLESVERFVSSGDKATLEVKITEERTLYRDGVVAPNQTNFDTEQIRYSLEFVDGKWRISDYKTVDGALLERAVLNSVVSSL